MFFIYHFLAFFIIFLFLSVILMEFHGSSAKGMYPYTDLICISNSYADLLRPFNFLTCEEIPTEHTIPSTARARIKIKVAM